MTFGKLGAGNFGRMGSVSRRPLNLDHLSGNYMVKRCVKGGEASCARRGPNSCDPTPPAFHSVALFDGISKGSICAR